MTRVGLLGPVRKTNSSHLIVGIKVNVGINGER